MNRHVQAKGEWQGNMSDIIYDLLKSVNSRKTRNRLSDLEVRNLLWEAYADGFGDGYDAYAQDSDDTL